MRDRSALAARLNRERLKTLREAITSNRIVPEDIIREVAQLLASQANPNSIAAEEERKLLFNAFAFADLEVSDVMVPRNDIRALASDCAIDEVIETFAETGHTRLPVFEGDLDHILGLIHIKDMVRTLNDRDNFQLISLLHPVLAVPDSMPASRLLNQMRQERVKMAIVIDEYGGTDGLVTSEDLIEEIVGDILDEHDLDLSDEIVAIDDRTYELSGRARIDDVEEMTGFILVNDDLREDIQTFGGLIFALFGEVPMTGDMVTDDEHGTEYDILDADPRQVKRLRLRLSAEAPLLKTATMFN